MWPGFSEFYNCSLINDSFYRIDSAVSVRVVLLFDDLQHGGSICALHCFRSLKYVQHIRTRIPSRIMTIPARKLRRGGLRIWLLQIDVRLLSCVAENERFTNNSGGEASFWVFNFTNKKSITLRLSTETPLRRLYLLSYVNCPVSVQFDVVRLWNNSLSK